MFEEALSLLNKLECLDENKKEESQHIMMMFLEENFKIGLQLHENESIKKPVELKEYAKKCYDTLRLKNPWSWCSIYFNDLICELKYSPEEENWENICRQCSMFEFLHEVTEDTFFSEYLRLNDFAELIDLILYVGIRIGNPKELVVPKGIPNHHWWWRLPKLPTEKDYYYNMYIQYPEFALFE